MTTEQKLELAAAALADIAANTEDDWARTAAAEALKAIGGGVTHE